MTLGFETPSRRTVLWRLPVDEVTGPRAGGRHRLPLVYKTRDLVVLGIGAMIGAGIFTIAGQQAATTAGPAVVLSFVIAGLACLLSALSYAELSSTMPVAGSAYSFTYVAFGEIWAWVIGWSLILELQFTTAAVGRAWSLYATRLINDLGALTGVSWLRVPSGVADLVGQQQGFDLFAMVILVLFVMIVAIGARLSLYTLWFLVLAKVIVIAIVIAGGLLYFRAANFTPFVPPSRPHASAGAMTILDTLMGGTPHKFGLFGIFAATSAIAFAYIGFDLIATSAEETKDAPRRVPIGMIVSLFITIALYVGVAIVMVGMGPFRNLDPSTPLAGAFTAVGAKAMSVVIDAGAVIGLATVLLVMVICATRVVFAMARDGLLPTRLSVISKRYKVPTRAAMLVGVAVVATSQIDVWTFGKVSISTVEEMSVIGTLFVFLFVSAGVIALRRAQPDLTRGFRVPLVPLTPLFAIGATTWLIINLRVSTWEYFGAWMILGLFVYLGYGQRHSRLRHTLHAPSTRIQGRHRR